MTDVSVHQAKAKLSALLKAVAAGEEVVITNRNKPVAKLVPIERPGYPPVRRPARYAFEESAEDWPDPDKPRDPDNDT